ncbi:MAG: Amuc_1098 family type IV pilus outer membrane protein [Prosthecobacter sp.]
MLPLSGASDSTVSIAEKEVQRRVDLVSAQVNRLSEAESLLKAQKTGASLALYEEIFNTLPNLPMAQEIRTVALEGYVHVGLIRAQELMNAGDYPAAEKILNTLDGPNVAQGRVGIRQVRARMTDPDRYPPALTPGHIERVQEVQRLLTLAASQVETGMFDKALIAYEDALRLDPTNSAARRGMEKVESERARYFESARDHQRGRMLNGVNELWETKPPLRSSDITAMFGGAGSQATSAVAKGGRESISAKLRDIKIERIDFSGAALEEVLEYLRVRARDLDPQGKGIDFVMGVPKDLPLKPVSLNLTNVPIEEVLRYVTEVSGVSYRVEEYAVRIVSLSDTNQSIISKSYRVPPNFISTAPTEPAAGATAPADPFAAGGAAPAGGLLRRIGAKEFLEGNGVSFPEGAGANYNPAVNMLIVRNTAKNIEMVDMLVEQSLNTSPKMAVIEVKIVEINNSKLDEMGFDWLLEGFGSNVEFSGGTVGNAQNSTFAVNEFPENSALSATGMAPVTAGLRSSGDLGNRGIEDVLYGAVAPTSRRSPGIFSLAGVLTNPQFQVVWRALDQKTGIDLISRPSVVAKSGQKASVEVVREFIYPTEYDPPQIPTNIGGANDNTVVITFAPPPAVPVTPTTPTAFETRRVGMVLDVEPLISDDGRSVDLTITPEFTEFVGFVNYGSPIYSVTQRNDGFGLISVSQTELTPNTITQPIFSTKKIVSGVKVYDGATIVLGGLISDQSIVVDDRIPVIGDLPVVGRFFQSKVKQRRLKNMIMFVTVKVIDPSGNRINPQ